MTVRLNFLMVCAGIIFGAQVFAAETISVSPLVVPSNTDAMTQNVVNGYLQIQEQLHDTQLAIEANRQEAAMEAKQTAEALAARIQTLEQMITTERGNEVTSAQKNQQVTFMIAGAFGLTVLAAVLFMSWLQWRAVARLVELSALRQSGFSMGLGSAPPSLVTSAAVENSNAKLFGAVDSLQKRILELEQIARGPALVGEIPPVAPAIAEYTSGSSPDSKDREECVANLLAEGQSLLDAHSPEKALECFDVALGLEPKHAEALVKKGGALEKLGRTDEAIECYDRAIEANKSATIAYLQKGGLFNRLARYDEALQCYEQALRTQEKSQAA
jgi:tetratricopeptide (TPR) repeat protein